MSHDALPALLHGDEQVVLDGLQTRMLDLLRRKGSGLAGDAGGRIMIGLAGAPAAGKSTLAQQLADRLRRHHGPSFAAVVPLDGFHLAREVLAQRGLSTRRGAIDTFDAAGFAALLERLHSRGRSTVFAPSYSRELHDPVAARIPVPFETRVVIVEGNYLLSPGTLWRRSRQALDEVWYLDLSAETRLQRLITRHQRFGKTYDEALAKSTGVDARNGESIVRHREHAELIIEISDSSRIPKEGIMTDTAPPPTLPTGAQHEIAGDTHFGRVVATLTEVGASLRALTVDGLDIVQRYPLDAPPSLGAGIVMSPWPNRIDGGRWTYRGEPQQLSITDTDFGNASHGLLMSSPYTVAAHDESSITLAATIFANPGYPFVVETSVRYAVTPDGLETTHTFTNRGALDAPVAVGSHAYYRIGDVPTGDLLLQSSAATVYPNDARMLPGTATPVSGDFDLRAGGRVGQIVLDHCFTDQELVDGRHPTRLTAPDGRYVEVWSDASFGHVVLLTTRRFTDENGDRILAVAIEPQTAAANSLNNGIGTTWLKQGETFTARWGVTAMLTPAAD